MTTRLHLLGPVDLEAVRPDSPPNLPDWTGPAAPVALRVTHRGRTYEVRVDGPDHEWATFYRLDHVDAWLVHVQGPQLIDGRKVPTRLAIAARNPNQPPG